MHTHNPPPPPYYQPPVGHPPPPITTAPVIVQANVFPATITVTQSLGPNPARTQCRTCTAEVITYIKYSPTARTHLCALILCIFGCWPCAFMPYCTPSCQNVDHFCPNCHTFLGTHIS